MRILDPPDHGLGFIQPGIESEGRDRIAGDVVGSQGFVFPLFVVGDQGVGRGQDRLRRAIILFKRDDPGIRKIAFKIEDVADIRSAHL